jgi:hypothetical protein
MLDKLVEYNINADGTITIEYVDDPGYFCYETVTIEQVREHIRELSKLLVEAEDQRYFYLYNNLPDYEGC